MLIHLVVLNKPRYPKPRIQGANGFRRHRPDHFLPSATIAGVLWRLKNGPTPTWTRHLSACAIICMLALVLRGGSLATLVTVVGLSPKAAIIFSAVLSAAVFLSGLRLQILSQRVPGTEPDDGGGRLTIAFIVYLVLFLPVVIWNAQHDWGSF